MSSSACESQKLRVSLLDYGAGNVRSVRNAILENGYEIDDITCPSEIDKAQVIVFPGVGSYRSATTVLEEKGYVEPLKAYLKQNRPFLGICLGMQTLFESSTESSDGEVVKGLGIIPGHVIQFDSTKMAVPHIGWNGRIPHQDSPVFTHVADDEKVYFVHSFYAPLTSSNQDWALTSTTYGDQRFLSSVQKGNIVACQFHPEKSGSTGLRVLQGFLEVSFPFILQNKYILLWNGEEIFTFSRKHFFIMEYFNVETKIPIWKHR